MEPTNNTNPIADNIKWIHKSQKAEDGRISTDGDIQWSEANEQGKVSGTQKILVFIKDRPNPIEYEIKIHNISNDGKEAAIEKMNTQMKKMVVLALMHGVCVNKKITYGQKGGYREVDILTNNVVPLEIGKKESFSKEDFNQKIADAKENQKKIEQIRMAKIVNKYVLPALMNNDDLTIEQSQQSEQPQQPNTTAKAAKWTAAAVGATAAATAAIAAGANYLNSGAAAVADTIVNSDIGSCPVPSIFDGIATAVEGFTPYLFSSTSTVPTYTGTDALTVIPNTSVVSNVVSSTSNAISGYLTAGTAAVTDAIGTYIPDIGDGIATAVEGFTPHDFTSIPGVCDLPSPSFASEVVNSILDRASDIGSIIYDNSAYIAAGLGVTAAGYLAYKNRNKLSNAAGTVIRGTGNALFGAGSATINAGKTLFNAGKATFSSKADSEADGQVNENSYFEAGKGAAEGVKKGLSALYNVGGTAINAGKAAGKTIKTGAKELLNVGVPAAAISALSVAASYLPSPSLDTFTGVAVDQTGTLINNFADATGTRVAIAAGLGAVALAYPVLKNRVKLPSIETGKNVVRTAQNGFSALKRGTRNSAGKLLAGLNGLKNRMTLPSIFSSKEKEEEEQFDSYTDGLIDDDYLKNYEDDNILDPRVRPSLAELENASKKVLNGSDPKDSIHKNNFKIDGVGEVEGKGGLEENYELLKKQYLCIINLYENNTLNLNTIENFETALNLFERLYKNDQLLNNKTNEQYEKSIELMREGIELAKAELTEKENKNEDNKRENGIFSALRRLKNRMTLPSIFSSKGKEEQIDSHTDGLIDDDYLKNYVKDEAVDERSVEDDDLEWEIGGGAGISRSDINIEKTKNIANQKYTNIIFNYQCSLPIKEDDIHFVENHFKFLLNETDADSSEYKDLQNALKILNDIREILDKTKQVKEKHFEIFVKDPSRKVSAEELLSFEFMLNELKKQRDDLAEKGIENKFLEKDIELMEKDLRAAKIADSKQELMLLFNKLSADIESYKNKKMELKTASEKQKLLNENLATFTQVVDLYKKFKDKVPLPEGFEEVYFFSLTELLSDRTENLKPIRPTSDELNSARYGIMKRSSSDPKEPIHKNSFKIPVGYFTEETKKTNRNYRTTTNKSFGKKIIDDTKNLEDQYLAIWKKYQGKEPVTDSELISLESKLKQLENNVANFKKNVKSKSLTNKIANIESNIKLIKTDIKEIKEALDGNRPRVVLGKRKESFSGTASEAKKAKVDSDPHSNTELPAPKPILNSSTSSRSQISPPESSDSDSDYGFDDDFSSSDNYKNELLDSESPRTDENSKPIPLHADESVSSEEIDYSGIDKLFRRPAPIRPVVSKISERDLQAQAEIKAVNNLLGSGEDKGTLRAKYDQYVRKIAALGTKEGLKKHLNGKIKRNNKNLKESTKNEDKVRFNVLNRKYEAHLKNLNENELTNDVINFRNAEIKRYDIECVTLLMKILNVSITSYKMINDIDHRSNATRSAQFALDELKSIAKDSTTWKKAGFKALNGSAENNALEALREIYLVGRKDVPKSTNKDRITGKEKVVSEAHIEITGPVLLNENDELDLSKQNEIFTFRAVYSFQKELAAELEKLRKLKNKAS